MLNKALYLQLFWSSHTHILFKGNCYSTLLKQYHERAHCLRLAMPLVCVCLFYVLQSQNKEVFCNWEPTTVCLHAAHFKLILVMNTLKTDIRHARL